MTCFIVNCFYYTTKLVPFVAWTWDTRYWKKRQMGVNKSHRGSVFLVDPHEFQRRSASQIQTGWLWQTWSDTMDVLRNCLFPEIPSTYALSWTVVVHKDKSEVMLLALPSPWQNELCSLCQEDTHNYRVPDGYLRSQWMQHVYQLDIQGLTLKKE